MSGAAANTPVVLLHGIWNARAWLAPLAARLRAAGFAPRILGYASVVGGPEAALPALIQTLRTMPGTAIVGHSLGGMMALEALRRAPDLPVARVVCLGSPLRGSGTARQLAGRPWALPVLGRSAEFLQRGFQAWDGNAEVGMVAGNVPHGIGRLLPDFDPASDGTVALEETRLPGLRDHCVVASSHSGLVFSAPAAQQAAAFLREGRFRH
ncbi:lipase family alpha/beta hydrolase [Luteimonas aquatica]|uniref:lipase family alpha/beta hydrolase n=1 Tax=Luteimonas aquatica TaxID=450364 RepID=UPI001F55C12B|nr:alpha/beta hydrolase [Luteimonas aquatica]